MYSIERFATQEDVYHATGNPEFHVCGALMSGFNQFAIACFFHCPSIFKKTSFVITALGGGFGVVLA